MEQNNKCTLEQSLMAFRVIHTPSKFSWKQHWVNDLYSSDSLLRCTVEERQRFSSRLKESKVTLMDNVRSIKNGRVVTLQDILDIITDENYKGVNKIDRKVMYSSGNGERPVGKKAFEVWDGLQVIDMDIKDEWLARRIKYGLFERLKKYNWFVGVVTSSSGKGLHVYTKIQIAEDDNKDPRKKKLLYLTNFRHKFSFVYLACLSIMDEGSFDKDDLLVGNGKAHTNPKPWMDLSMFKPQQGAFLPYDPSAMFSTHFFEDFIYVNFDNVEDMGHPDVDWVSYPDLKELFKRWEWFEEDEDRDTSIEVKDAPELLTDTHNRIHYKHFERWRLANTLVKLYGVDQGYKYMRQICSLNTKDKELQSDCITANRHNKPIDVWAVNQLNNKHGFQIKLNIPQKEVDIQELYSSIDNIENPTLIRESKYTKDFFLKKNEYLGNIKWDLLNNLGRITLIEAGAGVGKTEMVKSLTRDGKKIIMVMPFTSTIKSKVEKVKGWSYYYGNKKVRLDGDTMGVAMTIDKFSKMNLMEIKEYGFDYIFIDESHLMFQSEYRPVMPKVIDLIRNTEVPIILMSGTPVGETVFFDDIVHLRVKKEDVRRKEFNMYLCDKPEDINHHMCRQMAKDIVEGRRVLFPSNKGTLYKEQIKGEVQFLLEREFQYFEPIVINYYKKANVGEEFMNDINFEKTIKNTQILMCSNYLSVGVDILDKYQFSIYFNDLWMPQEIEQFANRLRSNDLYIYLYIAKNDSDGNSRNITRYSPLDLRLNDDEMKDCHSIVQMCNRMIERNPTEYKYNSLISSIIQNNKYIEYNEVENKYYLNDIAFKTIFFERKYREFVQQLPVIAKGMKAYGYTYSSKDLGVFTTVDKDDMVALLDASSASRNQMVMKNIEMVDELLKLITEDRLGIYKEVMEGKYDIKKGDNWKEDSSKYIMTVRSVEVFEKVVPLFISMSKLLRVEDIKDVFQHCRMKDGTYNMSAIVRVKTLINIIFNSRKERLDLPIKEFMEKSYKFAEKEKCDRSDLLKFINDFATEYAHRESNERIKIYLSPLTMKTIQDSLYRVFRCLVDVSRPKNGKITMKKNEILWEVKDKDNTTIESNKNLYFVDELLGMIGEEDISELL